MAAFALLVSTLAVAHAVINVHIVPHTHDDVGWLKTVDQYYSGANNSIQHAGVRLIINSVINALAENPERKFTYVEQAFFQRWWREQNEATRTLTRRLVRDGQLNFANGGWCMHDEAAAHYVAMIDQTTLGHRVIREEFGDAARPTVGWQLDPFGHSAVQASLMSAEMGFTGLFFGRIDYQDIDARHKNKSCEFVWRSSPSLGADAQVFSGLTGEYEGNYGAPDQFDWNGDAEPIEDNPDLDTFNVKARVDQFVARVQEQAGLTLGNNVMWTMGSDFNYEDAQPWYVNIDKLIKAANADGRVRAFYSSPAEYVTAKLAEAQSGAVKWPLVTGDNADFFPYADGPHQFWTGYFTSRPALKHYIRTASGLFNTVKQIQALAGVKNNTFAGGPELLQKFEEALGVSQHHDGVSGTAKQHVTFDYIKRLARGQFQAEAVHTQAINTILGTAGSWSACRRLNESVCSVSQNNPSFAVAVYNALGQQRTELLRVPVSSPGVVVTDASGRTIPSQVTMADTLNNYHRNTSEAQFVATFQATLPAAGAMQFAVRASAQSSSVDVVPARGADVIIANDFVELTFSGTNGLLSSWLHKPSNLRVNVNQNFCYYKSSTGNRDSGQPSGAYIFRPITDDCLPVSGSQSAAITLVTRGSLVQEVRQTFSPWLTQVVRLGAGQQHADFEYTVGEIPLSDPTANQTEQQCVSWRQTGNCDPNGPREPQNDKACNVPIVHDASGFCECFNGRRAAPVGCSHVPFTCAQQCLYTVGKEVVSRFSTSIASAGQLYTDSNGRDILHRRRNLRPYWDLKQTEQVAGNYFPVNAAAYIRDSNAQLTLLVDTSQGAGSIVDGQLEAMIHRRLTHDDYRGVGEPMNETETVGSYATAFGGAKFGNGLIIRGTHQVFLAPPASSASYWRPLADRNFFAAEPLFAPGVVSPGATSGVSALAAPLPANIQLITLHSLGPKQFLVRLAHQFGVGEDATLSQPASVDLGALFSANSGVRVVGATEVSLSANHNAAEIAKRRQISLAFSNNDEKPQPWRSVPLLDFAVSPVVSLGPLEIKTYIVELN